MKHIFFITFIACFLGGMSVFATDYYTFSELRSLISSETGEFQLTGTNKSLEGIVISDAGNPNMEVNPNLTYSSIDFTESAKTAYIQSFDGSFGLRVKTASEVDNTLSRYSKVTINLDGLTLVKEANPERYTLKGLTSSNIALSVAGTAADVVSKTRTISTLSDADIYTYVELTNVEAALPYGSYFNVNVGYTLLTDWNLKGTSTAPRVDATPTLLIDDAGNNLNLITNIKASWARKTLPTGFGSVKGIVVHSKLLRFGYGSGEIGRYSLRVLEESAVSMNETSKFKKLVEWNWIGETTQTATPIVKNEDGTVAAKIGSGSLSCTVSAVAPALGAHPIYHADPNSKDIPNGALTYNTNWWNTGTNTGEAIVCKFSTSGISGKNLNISFSQGGGSGSNTTQHVPVYWQIEYSTDGTNYTVLPNSTYAVRPLVPWTNTPLFSCAGLITHSFALPSSLFDQSEVYLKLKVKDNICAQDNSIDGAETGRITATENTGVVSVRLGVVSVKYQEESTTGLEEEQFGDQANIYISDAGVLNINSLYEIEAVEIYNLNGQAVYKNSLKGKAVEIDLSSQPSAVYAVKLIAEEGASIFKVIKK